MWEDQWKQFPAHRHEINPLNAEFDWLGFSGGKRYLPQGRVMLSLNASELTSVGLRIIVIVFTVITRQNIVSGLSILTRPPFFASLEWSIVPVASQTVQVCRLGIRSSIRRCQRRWPHGHTRSFVKLRTGLLWGEILRFAAVEIWIGDGIIQRCLSGPGRSRPRYVQRVMRATSQGTRCAKSFNSVSNLFKILGVRGDLKRWRSGKRFCKCLSFFTQNSQNMLLPNKLHYVSVKRRSSYRLASAHMSASASGTRPVREVQAFSFYDTRARQGTVLFH